MVWAVKHFRPYLYGHHCDVFTDHLALKSLLSTPQPSSKLARWGMAIQELDIHIHYRPGKANSNADALSRFPDEEEEPCDTDAQVPAVVATTYPSSVQAKDGEPTLATLQRSDSNLREIIEYLEHRTLPADEKRGRELALSRSQYQIVEGVLYHVEKDQTLRITLRKPSKRSFFTRSTTESSVVISEMRRFTAYSVNTIGGKGCGLTS